jgi:hypothetical protein
MGDKLTQSYDEFTKQHEGEIDLFQAFQAGFSASAVSMRERAMTVVREAKIPLVDLNATINKIGALPDVPQ